MQSLEKKRLRWGIGQGPMVNVSGPGPELKRPWTYTTDLQDLRPKDCFGPSEEGEHSEEDTGEDANVDEFNND